MNVHNHRSWLDAEDVLDFVLRLGFARYTCTAISGHIIGDGIYVARASLNPSLQKETLFEFEQHLARPQYTYNTTL